MDLPIIPKTATYYSQCDYLNMENATVRIGAALKRFCDIHIMTVLALVFLTL